LERYREGRRLLASELGLEPGPALQQLERAILRHDLRREASAPVASPRGAVVAVGASLGPLLSWLCADGRELVLVELAHGEGELESAGERLRVAQNELADLPAVRAATFVSIAPPDDLARLAEETGAELIVAGDRFSTGAVAEIAAAAACDVAFAANAAR